MPTLAAPALQPNSNPAIAYTSPPLPNAGRDSLDMLRLAVRRVKDAGWAPVQLDVTVIAEQPSIIRHRDKMRARLAGALGVEMSAVMVKGKTNERMGWIGKGKGLAVIAVATLEPT